MYSNISLSLIQLLKYSQLIQDDYLNAPLISDFSYNIEQLQVKENIKKESIETFFNLLNDKNSDIKSDQYYDLCKLSEKLKVKVLQKTLEQYAKDHSNDVDFIINLMLEENSNKSDELFSFDYVSKNMESILSKNVNKCLQNKKFGKLPFSDRLSNN